EKNQSVPANGYGRNSDALGLKSFRSPWSAHGGSAGALAVGLPVEPIRRDRKDDPAEIVDKAAAKHDPAGNWPDRGAINQFVEMRCDFGMDRDLAEKGGRLNRDDPDIGSPDGAAGGANEADMMTRMQVVFGEDNSPGVVVVFSAQDLGIQMRLHVAGARAPDIEIAIASRFKSEKNGKQHADQNHRQ